MQVRELMTTPVVRIHPEENAAVAARALEHYNIGFLPVCGSDGRVKGLVTDRDLVTRCLAAGKDPSKTTVDQVMTRQVVFVKPETELREAAQIMAGMQVRRLPVLENGRLSGILSLGDLAQQPESGETAAKVLHEISSGVSG